MIKKELILKSGLKVTYEVRYTARVRILLRVTDGKVLVSCPKRTTFKFIEETLLKNEEYILKRLTEEIKTEKVIHVWGKAYQVNLLEGKKNSIFFSEDQINLTLKNPSLVNYQKLLNNYFKEELKKEVETLLPDLIKDYPKTIIPELKYKKMTSCYGNYYKSKHLINLSTELVRYEKIYTKCVLYHEMTHIFYFNHQAGFYNLFEEKFKDAKKTQHQLKMIKYKDFI